jgi:SAM-dependent methyltransferase
MFGRSYASAYDAMYEAKDYAFECDLVEAAFERFANGPVESLLDLGCGTGGHAILLARRGYEVAGVDRSAAMLQQARRKAGAQRVDLALREGDARSVELGRTFDAVLAMFAVIGYQLTNADVRALLRTARRHLRPGGVLVFDAWHGPGVIAHPPGSGARDVDTPDGSLRRVVSSELDVRHHLCTVRYRLVTGEREDRETHVVRYFFPLELELFCDVEGLELVSLTPFGTLDGEPTRETWNLSAVARAR